MPSDGADADAPKVAVVDELAVDGPADEAGKEEELDTCASDAASTSVRLQAALSNSRVALSFESDSFALARLEDDDVAVNNDELADCLFGSCLRFNASLKHFEQSPSVADDP